MTRVIEAIEIELRYNGKPEKSETAVSQLKYSCAYGVLL